MGIYDRDYIREEPRGWLERGARTMVTNIIIVNVAIYLVDVLFCFDASTRRYWLSDFLALDADVWRHPLYLWQLLTYGFAHDPSNVFHVLLNMYMLWLFGHELEGILGRREFLSVYLSTIVLAGVGWLAGANAYRASAHAILVGASGGVMGIAVIYALRFPHRTFYVWFIPMPVWILVGLIVLKDFLSFRGTQLGGDGGGVAYEAHLAGALCGVVYHRWQWHLGRLIDAFPVRLRGGAGRRPKLRVHSESEPPARENLDTQVDRLLAKIQREGEASLTASERATLEEASRRYRGRRR